MICERLARHFYFPIILYLQWLAVMKFHVMKLTYWGGILSQYPLEFTELEWPFFFINVCKCRLRLCPNTLDLSIVYVYKSLNNQALSCLSDLLCKYIPNWTLRSILVFRSGFCCRGNRVFAVAGLWNNLDSIQTAFSLFSFTFMLQNIYSHGLLAPHKSGFKSFILFP